MASEILGLFASPELYQQQQDALMQQQAAQYANLNPYERVTYGANLAGRRLGGALGGALGYITQINETAEFGRVFMSRANVCSFCALVMSCVDLTSLSRLGRSWSSATPVALAVLSIKSCATDSSVLVKTTAGSS